MLELQNVDQIVRGKISLVDKQFSVGFCYYLIKAESVYRNIYLPILYRSALRDVSLNQLIHVHGAIDNRRRR